MRRRLLTLIACLCCLAAVGATAARAQPVLSASQYRAQANAICNHFNDFQLPTRGPLADRLAALLEQARTGDAALRRLRPPQSLSQLHAQLMDTNAKRIEMLASMVARLKAGTITIGELAAQVARSPFAAQANALWEKVGAFACVQY